MITCHLSVSHSVLWGHNSNSCGYIFPTQKTMVILSRPCTEYHTTLIADGFHGKRIPKVFTSKNARIPWPVKSLPAWFYLGRWHRCTHPLILHHYPCGISSKPGLAIEKTTRIGRINFKWYLAMLDLCLNQTIYLWRNESTEKVCCPGGKQIRTMSVSWATWYQMSQAIKP